jgi:hypothetical protein
MPTFDLTAPLTNILLPDAELMRHTFDAYRDGLKELYRKAEEDVLAGRVPRGTSYTIRNIFDPEHLTYKLEWVWLAPSPHA